MQIFWYYFRTTNFKSSAFPLLLPLKIVTSNFKGKELLKQSSNFIQEELHVIISIVKSSLWEAKILAYFLQLNFLRGKS